MKFLIIISKFRKKIRIGYLYSPAIAHLRIYDVGNGERDKIPRGRLMDAETLSPSGAGHNKAYDI